MKVRYAIGGIVAAALIALPASAAATPGGQVASLTAQQCSQERADIGKRAFRKRYGAKHAMRSCVSRSRPQVVTAVGTANQDCQEELAEIGAAEFIDEYGDDEDTDPVGDAMTACIAEDVDEILHPEDYGDGSDDGSDE